MLRTSSKKVKEKIKAYLINGFEDSGRYSDKDKDIALYRYDEVCDEVLIAFYEQIIEFDKGYYTSPKSNLFDGFVYWVSGLCDEINSIYYYKPIAKDIIAEWLEETEEEKNKYSEEQAERLITSLLWRELLAHSNINPYKWVKW